MGRVYSGRYSFVSTTAAQDLMTVTAPTTSVVRVISINVGQASDPGDNEAEMLPISVVRYASAGSGGTTLTANPYNFGHAATGVTFVRNNTTVGATPTVVYEQDWNVRMPWIIHPILWDDEIWVPPSGVLAVNLGAAPADELFTTATIVFEEFD